MVKRSQRKRQRKIAEKDHRDEELGRRRAEDPGEAHSTEQSDKDVSRSKRAQPTAGEKSIPNSRGKSKEPKKHGQQQAETYEENNVSKKEIGLMTRDKDTESHQHIATEQELKVAEKAREHPVEEQKAAKLKKRFLEEQQHETDDVWKGVTQKQQEVQQTVTDR